MFVIFRFPPPLSGFFCRVRQVKLKDGRMRQTPATFPAAAVDPTLSENFPSEKRLDVEPLAIKEGGPSLGFPLVSL